MTPPITYYGGKQAMLSRILPMIPPHTQYIEPFLGGGAVFWAKPLSRHEVINDIDERVTNFYWQCKMNFDRLNDMVQGTLHSEVHHKKSRELLADKNADPVARAWAFWVQVVMSVWNSPGRGFNHTSCGTMPKRTAGKRARFLMIQDRLKHVEIFSRDAVGLIQMKDSADTFFYLDPPYMGANQGHYAGYTDTDFEHLLIALESLSGQFLLSNYPSELLSQYAQKNDWSIALNASPRHVFATPKRPEVLVSNYVAAASLFD